MNKENQTPDYQISKAAIEKHPVLDNFSSIIFKGKDAARIDALRDERPHWKEEVTEEKIIEIARKLSYQYTELEEICSSSDTLYESLEESIGVIQCAFIIELCYIAGLCEELER